MKSSTLGILVALVAVLSLADNSIAGMADKAAGAAQDMTEQAAADVEQAAEAATEAAAPATEADLLAQAQELLANEEYDAAINVAEVILSEFNAESAEAQGIIEAAKAMQADEAEEAAAEETATN